MLIRQTNNEKCCMTKMLQTFFHARKLVCHEKSHISAHKWKWKSSEIGLASTDRYEMGRSLW